MEEKSQMKQIWMRDIERIFEATQCPERKLSYVVYMLTENAEFWWIMMEGRGEDVICKSQSKIFGGVLS